MQRFEDVVAWQKARALNVAVYRLTRTEPFVRDFGLASQIQRATISVMANIAEGFERGSLTEFNQFLSIAKGSCAEVRSHLYAAFDVGYIDEPTFLALKSQAEEVGGLLRALRRSVRQRAAERSPRRP